MSRDESIVHDILRYDKFKRSRVSGTCKNSAYRTRTIEATLIKHYRDVWLSPNGQPALRNAIDAVSKRGATDRPSRIAKLKQRLTSLDARFKRGKQNLPLVDDEDVSDLKRIVSDWKDDRAAVAKELAGKTRPVDTDADTTIEELHHLARYSEETESEEAYAAMRRIYQTVSM